MTKSPSDVGSHDETAPAASQNLRNTTRMTGMTTNPEVTRAAAGHLVSAQVQTIKLVAQTANLNSQFRRP